ncbi:MAG: prepilin-type N-terminal cleavage/methylation domain-containing protein [Oscillospiraceae bacterium]|nr:prepilin-type N-terminal cleavage/methylation domain-containing protein [Oscillospiraceae bacterium]
MKNNRKGFTLAELLIVVAIIAVLVAVAIPVFTTQLEKSRDATSVANMRAAYAEAQIAFVSESNTGNAVYDRASNTVTVSNVVIKTEDANDWSEQAGDLPFEAPGDPGESNTMTLVFTYVDGALNSVAFGS